MIMHISETFNIWFEESMETYDGEEDATGGVCRGVQTRNEVPADKVQKRANDQVWELRDD
jgi:hypothetical protein